MRSDGARTGGAGAAGYAHPYAGERGREGVLPPLSVRKNFFGNRNEEGGGSVGEIYGEIYFV